MTCYPYHDERELFKLSRGRSVVGFEAGTVASVLQELVADGQEVGVQVAVYSDGHRVIDEVAGAVCEGGAPVAPDTLFSIFSVAKAVTAFAAQMMADRGHLDLDEPIASYWPDFAANGKEQITLRHVLTHRAGIPQMPADVTPETMCDWEWMTGRIAGLTPILRPGVDSAYMAMSFGWVVGEAIRRTDPRHRMPDRFVREEICIPLGIDDLYLSLPDEAMGRYAKHTIVPDPTPPPDSLHVKALPTAVRLVPEIFSRPDVLACNAPAVNGIASARGLSRFFAMIAGEGELDGVRLISRERARNLLEPRAAEEEFEPVLMRNWRLSTSGFFLASSNKPAAGMSRKMVFAMGMGGTIAWADMASNSAAAITHNKMLNARSQDVDPVLRIARAVHASLGTDVGS